jgi:hypothetical protein
VSIQELQYLVELKAGVGTWYGVNKEVIDFEIIIGIDRNERTGMSRPTSRGAIHYSKAGAHVVPAPPNPSSLSKDG